MLTTIHLNIWLGIHLTRLSTEGLGPWHGEVRRAHQMLNAALDAVGTSVHASLLSCCVCVCVCARARVCVRACVRARVCARLQPAGRFNSSSSRGRQQASSSPQGVGLGVQLAVVEPVQFVWIVDRLAASVTAAPAAAAAAAETASGRRTTSSHAQFTASVCRSQFIYNNNNNINNNKLICVARDFRGAGARQRVSEQRGNRKPGRRGMSLA